MAPFSPDPVCPTTSHDGASAGRHVCATVRPAAIEKTDPATADDALPRRQRFRWRIPSAELGPMQALFPDCRLRADAIWVMRKCFGPDHHAAHQDDRDELGAIHRAVLALIEGLRFAHYASPLDVSKNGRPVFVWGPGDGDWGDFLALAAKAGATIVYTHVDELAEADLPDEEDAVLGAARELLVERPGEPFRLSVAFVVGMVVHFWMRGAACLHAVEAHSANGSRCIVGS